MTLNDTIQLVTVSKSYNEYGEVSENSVETKTEVMCDSGNGVTRSEFYEAYRAGIKLAAVFEMWSCDYGGQTILEHGGKRYKVERSFPKIDGSIQLNCSCADGL